MCYTTTCVTHGCTMLGCYLACRNDGVIVPYGLAQPFCPTLLCFPWLIFSTKRRAAKLIAIFEKLAYEKSFTQIYSLRWGKDNSPQAPTLTVHKHLLCVVMQGGSGRWCKEQWAQDSAKKYITGTTQGKNPQCWTPLLFVAYRWLSLFLNSLRDGFLCFRSEVWVLSLQ